MLPSVVSIDSLPNELFLKIFSEFTQEPGVLEHFVHAEEIKSNASTLLSVSQVCKRWREVSLNFGTLWASAIDVNHNRFNWARNLVSRAKAVPLVMRTGDNAHFKCDEKVLRTGAWRHVLAHPDKWGTFAVDSICACSDKRPLLGALTKPAPVLEYFMVRYMSYHPCLYVWNPRIVLPDNLFGGHAPHLHEVYIENMQISPSMDFSVWKQLKFLKLIQYIDDQSGVKISARKWLTILGDMLQLEQLLLYWNVGGDVSESSSSNVDLPDIHLDSLYKLTLMAACERNVMFDILKKLIVPSQCSTIVEVGNDNVYRIPFDSLKVAFQRRVDSWRHSTNGFLHCHFNNDPVHGRYGFRIRCNGSNNNADYSAEFSFQAQSMRPLAALTGGAVQWANAPYAFPRILKLLDYFPAQTVTMMGVGYIRGADIETLRPFLGVDAPIVQKPSENPPNHASAPSQFKSKESKPTFVIFEITV